MTEFLPGIYKVLQKTDRGNTTEINIFIIPMKTWCMHSVRLTTICCPIMNTRISAIGIRLMPLKTAQKSCYGVSSRKIIKNLSEGRNTSCLFVLSKNAVHGECRRGTPGRRNCRFYPENRQKQRTPIGILTL